MDLRTFLRNNANLKSRPRRRRHSIADVRFLHTLQDIPEKPEEEHVADERRHSTGSFAKTEKARSSSEPPNPPCCNESGIRPATIVNETETNSSETARSKRSLSREESEDLIEAVSNYVLSYTDDQENICSVNNLSPTSTGSSSPQESSKETSDEELALSDILRKVDTPMVSQRLRRGSTKDLELMERITSLTPITESSRSSSRASRSSSQNGLEIFSDINDGNEGTNHGLHCPTPKTAGKKEEMLGKILVSPHITRRGSLSDLLKSLSPNFDTRKENGLQGMGKDEELRPEYISLNAETQMKDQSGSLFPVNSGKYSPKVSVNEKHSSVKITDALGKANNSPVSLKRRTSGDLLNSLSSIADRVSFKASNTKKSLGSEAKKEKHEVSSVNKEKDDLFGRIMKSPCLTRRGSIGDVLNALTPNPVRRCPSPSPLTIKCDTHDELVLKTQPVSPEMPKLKDAERATCEPGVGKGLLAIVQQHVMNHSQAMQRRRSNSIASTEPHTGTMETVLKKWNEDRNRAANNESFVGKTSDKDSSQKGDIVINTTSSSMTATKNSKIKENNGSGTVTSTNTSKHIHDNNNNKINKSANTNQCNSANNTEVLNPQTHNPQENISEENKANVDHETTSSVPRQLVLVGSPSKHVPQGNSEQDVPSAKTPNRKISAPLPPRSVDAYHVPKRKSSVNVMKRSPVTVVISKDKAGKTEVHRKVSQFQIPSGVNLTDSRFLPLSKEEAEDYNRIKNAEESALPRKNSTVTMSSKVTVHGGSGAVVRKVGVASKRPVLDASLPTEERFAALSERYANLKAKIGGNDDKKKSTESSPNLVEKNDSGPSTEDTLTQSKCWTTVESIPVQVYVDQVFENPRDFTEAETKETLSGKNKSPESCPKPDGESDSGPYTEDTLIQSKCWTTVENITIQEYVDRVSDKPRDLTEAEKQVTLTGNDEDKQTKNGEKHDIYKSHMATNRNDFDNVISCINDSEKKASVDLNNNSKPSVTETQVEEDSCWIDSKTPLDLRPETPTQKTRTSVVAKLMNRKMKPRRKQSIVPCVVKRRSRVYTKECSGHEGIPASVAEFEKIRTFVENTVLRAPVRQEASNILDLLTGLSTCLTEIELVAICKECSKTLRTLDALGSLPTYLSLETVIINPSGTIKFKHLSTGISIDDLYLAPEHSNNFASEKTCIFSLAATLWSAADWRLTEAEKPFLSSKFQELLVSMTDDAPDARPCLYDVLKTCESLQIENDMTSRERCQALLWEYQASAAMDSDDTTKRKTVEGEKKHHDTLMGSISVAASFKGFLKQTTKPQERNPFVKTQNNGESFRNLDGGNSGDKRNETIPKLEEMKAEKTKVIVNSPMSEATSSNSLNSEKDRLASDSLNDRSLDTGDDISDQNRTRDRKRGHSLTEDEKQQLLSLLASTKLNKGPFYTGENDKKSDEIIKSVEDQSTKPPSPSLFAYPHYGQTESQMMFNPIIPAGRSASPSVHSDVSENQIPSVPTPTFVPIAVPIPSVAPVPMPPYWYVPQGGMMSFPHPAMSPVPFHPVDSSVTSNQSAVSTDSDVSNLSDVDSRPKNKNCATPKSDKSEGLKADTQKNNKGCKQNKQDNKASKLPRPIWQRPVPKSRTTSEELESNAKVVRRRVPFNDEFNEGSEGTKPVRARTPSPSLGRRAAPQEVNPPRSQTPPVYWTRDGVDMSPRNKPRARASTGSFPNRPPSPSSLLDGRRRSSSATLGSITNSPVKGRKNQGSRPSSPAGSRSNSPVSMLVSKFEQMSQEYADSSPRVRSNSVTSMISRFGSSSLVPEDRLAKGQFKPHNSTTPNQPASKTGPFRPSSVRSKVHSASDIETSILRSDNSILSQETGKGSDASKDESSTHHPGNPREVQRSGSDPGSTDSRERRVSSSHCMLQEEKESTSEKCHDSRTRLLENIRKWTSEENILRDCSSSEALEDNAQERLASGLSLFSDYCTKRDQGDQKGNPKARLQGSSSGKSKSSTYSGRSSSSNDLRNDYIIKSGNVTHNLSKPWQDKDSSLNGISIKSSLDSEPVREKGSPRLRPRDPCLSPERDSSIPFCDVRSPNDLLWSPRSDTHQFEIPVDLAILDATTPIVSSPPASVGGLDWTYGGVDGNVISPPFPLSPGSLKDFKPSNYFTSVTFKCGEMEPERDTNCILNRPSRDTTEYVSSDCVSNRRDPTGNYVRRFERKILRSTGDLETEVFASNSTSVQKSCYPTENSSFKKEINDNPRPIPNSPLPSKSESSSIIAHVNGNPKTPRTRSRIDQVVRSRHPSGDCPPGKDIAAVSKNPSSPMTLKKIMSNPISQDASTPQRRISTSKRNSLPSSQPINLSPGRDRSSPVENRTITKSSSHTYLSQKHQKVFKSSPQNNPSVRQSSGDLSKSSPKEGNLGKSSPYSKPMPSSNPSPNVEESKSRGSSTTAKPGNPGPSKERHGAKGHSSNPHAKASRTVNSTATSTDPSESNPVRYPYTRRGSLPAGGSSTYKPSPKTTSNPTSPLHAKPPKAQIEFFGAAGADNPRGGINPRDSNRRHENLKDTHQNPGPRSQGDFESSVDSSKAPSQCAKSSSTSGFSSHELASEQSSNSMGKTEESEVFYIPRSDETLLKSDTPSGKSSKRFPSNSSSDSGLNLSDPDESRGSIGKGKKNYRARSPPSSPTTLSPSHSPSPTSPKFPIGHNIFYDPKDHKPPLPSSEEGPLSVSQNDPTTLAFLSNSIQQENVSNPFKASVGKSEESPNKPTRSDNDNFKHFKSDMSKITDGSSPNSDEKTNVYPEKPKEGSAAAKLATDGRMMKSTAKEFELASTPPPDILGRPASKSPPSSSRVDSKELLGQLVKKVLNSAAAKQGSSPNTSFAESAAKESGKGKRVTLTNETTEAKQKEKIGGQGKNPTLNSSKHKSGLSDTEKATKIKETGLMNSSETSSTRNPDEITPTGTLRSHLGTLSETPISPNNASILESSSRKEQSLPGAKGVLSTIIDMIHDEFAFDGYLDDGVEDVNMAEYVLSLAGMSEENFKEAITDQYSDLYWDEDLLHEMYEAVTEGQQTRRSTLQFSESTVSDISPPESISLSREESYLSLEPLYFNSISRSSSERSGTGARDILISPMGEATEFLPIKVIAPEMQADIQELLTPIFEDYHRVMGVKLISSVEGLTEKLGTKIVEISQQLMLERRAKKKSMNSYNKMAEVENKKDVKDLASKLVNEIEGSDKKIIYLKNVQRQLRNVYAERFGLDTSLLYSFLVSYNTSCVTLVSELNNSFLNFSPIWNQRGSESIEILDESLSGPSLQSGTKLGLFSYLFDRHAMSQAYVRYFLYTFRYIATTQELFSFIREKCSASLRTDSSGQVYNHQLQIRYRGLDLLSEWIDSFYQFDFKTNPNLIKELLAFVKDELILVDRSERGHYLMELISEKQKRDLNNNLSSDEPSDFVAVLQLEEPQAGLSPVDVLRKPLGSRKAKSPVQCFRRAPPEKDTTYKATLYLKALSILDHSSRILAEQLTLIQQDLFFHIHPVHFLNSRAHGIGVGRHQSPTKERDNMFGFSTGSRRASEMSSLGEGLVSREQNMYVSEPSTDGLLEELLEHAHDVSLWVAVEICSASSIKAQLALITKFVNAARYCCEIRNYSTCIQIVDALEMFVIRQLPVWRQVPTKTTETLEELKAVKVLLKTDSSWLMKSEASREKPTIPCFLLFVIHVQQQELGGFTLPNDMYKWTKMRSTARLVDQIRLFKQMRYAFQTNDEVKERLKQRIQECKSENLHALASENASNFHLSSSQGSRKFHDAFRKMKATFGGHN